MNVNLTKEQLKYIKKILQYEQIKCSDDELKINQSICDKIRNKITSTVEDIHERYSNEWSEYF